MGYCGDLVFLVFGFFGFWVIFVRLDGFIICFFLAGREGSRVWSKILYFFFD